MDEKLVAVAVRWRNAQLNSSLTQARASGDQIDVETGPLQTALQSRIDELEDGAKERSAETVRLRQQIEAGDHHIAAADEAQAEAEARFSEMRDSLQRAEQEKARISADLASVKRELATTQKQVAQIYQQAAALANERDELRARLAAVNAGLGQSQAAKVQPENEVAALRERVQTEELHARTPGILADVAAGWRHWLRDRPPGRHTAPPDRAFTTTTPVPPKTSTNVANHSASKRRGISRSHHKEGPRLRGPSLW